MKRKIIYLIYNQLREPKEYNSQIEIYGIATLVSRKRINIECESLSGRGYESKNNDV